MSENKESVRRHFNIIDAIIILAVAAIVAGVALRYNLTDKIGAKSNRDTVIISFSISDIKPTSVDAMIAGDIFYIDSNNMELGELLSVTSSDAVQYLENSDGEITRQYDSERRDVTGEIKAKGALTDSGFMLGGTQYLGANKELYVRSQNIMVTIRITGIREAA